MSRPALAGATMDDARRRLGLGLAFLSYASWGLLSPVGKRLLEDFGPLWLNAVRFLLASAVALPLLAPRASLRLLRDAAVLRFNLLANASLTLFLYSLVKLPATFSTLGFYTAPLWTAALAAVALRERVGAAFAPAALGLLGGGYLALFGAHAPAGDVSRLGLLLAVGSAVVWAFYTVDLRRHAPRFALKPLMGASLLFGAAYYLALALLLEDPPAWGAVPAASWGWMALHVAFPTLAAFILFNAALQRAPAGEANILIGAELAFTALFAWLLFGDSLSAVQVAGLAVVLASVTAYLWARERRAAQAPAP